MLRLTIVVLLALTVAELACAGVAAMLPPFSADKPQQISIAYVDDSVAATARWVVPALTAPLARAARFERSTSVFPPWRTGPEWSAPVPRVPIDRVQLVGRREGDRVFLRVRSARRANRVSLLIRGTVREVTIGGMKLPPRPARFRSRVPAGWTSLSMSGGDGMVIELTAAGRVELIASDMTFGLPAGSTPLVDAQTMSARAITAAATTTRAYSAVAWPD